MYPNNYHALDADVIVIGAGVAGMAAAYVLLEKVPSLHILILEAENQIGGRHITSGSLNAERINQSQKQLFDLIELLDVQVERVICKGETMIAYGEKVYKRKNVFGVTSCCAKLEFAGFIREIDRLCGKVPLDPVKSSQTMESFIEKNLSHKRNKAIIRYIIFTNFGIDPKHISLGFYLFYCLSTCGISNQIAFATAKEQIWLKGGRKEICDKIATLLEDIVSIRVNTKIVNIRRHKYDVEIQSKETTFYAKYVILTVPPRALLRIEFSPKLPNTKTEALNNFVDGKLLKFAATFEEPFWKPDGHSGDIYVLNNTNQVGSPMLCCFDLAVASQPTLIGYCLQTAEQEDILKQLKKYFKRDVPKPVSIVVEKYQCGNPLSYNDVEAFATKTDRILYAGAETALLWYGSVCGSVVSANRVARELLYDIRPAVLTVEDMNAFRTSLSTLKKALVPHRSIYVKLISPFYRTSGLLIAAMLAIAVRKVWIYVKK